MNKVGMAVDVSHCGDTTTLDAFQASKKPVLITHANCRALNPNHPRCKTDEAIKAMAAKGGVMGITEVRMFVSPTEPTRSEEHTSELQSRLHLVCRLLLEQTNCSPTAIGFSKTSRVLDTPDSGRHSPVL